MLDSYKNNNNKKKNLRQEHFCLLKLGQEKTFECKEEEYTVCFLPSTRVDCSQLLGVQLKIQTQENHSIYNQSLVYTAIFLPSTANESIPSCKLILNKYNPSTAESNATQRQLKPTFSFRLVSAGHTIKVQALAQLMDAGAGRYMFAHLTLRPP